MKGTSPNFDRIARPYRLLEYLSIGRLLEKTRFTFMHRMQCAKKALVLGDGDGRFTAKLLQENDAVRVTAVDISPEMLRLMRERCSWAGGRLKTVNTDALSFCREDSQKYDLVVTHFFLDCLSQSEVNELAALVASLTEPEAVWVLSEFAIPRNAMRLPARVLVRGLYAAFRIVTGLRTSRLPDHSSALKSAGFMKVEMQSRMAGILCAERWVRRETVDQDRRDT